MITITISKEYFEDQLNNWKHSCFTDNTVTLDFAPEDWAPGLWCGTEGLQLKFEGILYKITKIDLDGRQVFMEEVS